MKGGASLIVLSDREVDADNAPIPMCLVVGAVHHALIEAGHPDQGLDDRGLG